MPCVYIYMYTRSFDHRTLNDRFLLTTTAKPGQLHESLSLPLWTGAAGAGADCNARSGQNRSKKGVSTTTYQCFGTIFRIEL